MISKYSLFIIIITVFVVILSCNKKEDPVNPDFVYSEERAATNYKNHCGGCHGQRFGSFIERDWLYGNTENEVILSIKNGKPQNGMPSYQSAFTEEEINELAQYILKETNGKSKEDFETGNTSYSGLIKSDDLNFRVETINAEINGKPWGMVQLPNGEFLVTVLEGKLLRITKDGEQTEISGLPNITAGGQGGLLDVILHPEFVTNSYIYLSFSTTNPNNSSEKTTAVSRSKLFGNSLTETETLFTALPYLTTEHHFGSRLLFDREDYLYISVGDRGFRDDYPQNLNNSLGKVHRLKDDGQIPVSNPFYHQSGANQSIFSYGIRNPQGLALHPVDGTIWEGEHGPQGGDEINILNAGKNYGWPVISYGINYNGTAFTDITEKQGMEQPLTYWTPSIAPCDMDFLNSSFYGKWKNDLFIGSLKFQYLHRLKMNGNQIIGQEQLLKDIGRVRDVHTGKDGYMYLLVESPGRLLRLVPEQ